MATLDSNSKKRGIFICIEGLDATGKTTLVDSLAKEISATKLKSPPTIQVPALQGPSDIRSYFDEKNPIIRRAYYRSANLFASEIARSEIEDGSNVVMDRYWASTVAYSALDCIDWFHQWQGRYPEELIVPDLTILLTVNEEIRLQRLHGRNQQITPEEHVISSSEHSERRQMILSAYRSFPNIFEIDTSGLSPDQVLEKCIEVIRARSILS